MAYSRWTPGCCCGGKYLCVLRGVFKIPISIAIVEEEDSFVYEGIVREKNYTCDFTATYPGSIPWSVPLYDYYKNYSKPITGQIFRFNGGDPYNNTTPPMTDSNSEHVYIGNITVSNADETLNINCGFAAERVNYYEFFRTVPSSTLYILEYTFPSGEYISGKDFPYFYDTNEIAQNGFGAGDGFFNYNTRTGIFINDNLNSVGDRTEKESWPSGYWRKLNPPISVNPDPVPGGVQPPTYHVYPDFDKITGVQFTDEGIVFPFDEYTSTIRFKYNYVGVNSVAYEYLHGTRSASIGYTFTKVFMTSRSNIIKS